MEYSVIEERNSDNRLENGKRQRNFPSSFGQSQSGTGERVSVRVTGDTVQWGEGLFADIILETPHVTLLSSVKEDDFVGNKSSVSLYISQVTNN